MDHGESVLKIFVQSWELNKSKTFLLHDIKNLVDKAFIF